MARRGQSALGNLDIYRGGMTPFERATSQALSRTPSAFDFSELEERYPTRSVMPAIPAYAQREIDEEELEMKAAELAVRQRQAELNIYESRINQDRERFNQIPSAREEMAKLDPSSPDFIQNAITVQNAFPLAFEDNAFYKNVVEPLYKRHERLQQNQDFLNRKQTVPEQQVMTSADFRKALVERDALLGNKKLEDIQETDPDRAFAIEELNRIIFNYQQQNIPRGGFGVDVQNQMQPSVQTITPTEQEARPAGGLNILRQFIGE